MRMCDSVIAKGPSCPIALKFLGTKPESLPERGVFCPLQNMHGRQLTPSHCTPLLAVTQNRKVRGKVAEDLKTTSKGKKGTKLQMLFVMGLAPSGALGDRVTLAGVSSLLRGSDTK